MTMPAGTLPVTRQELDRVTAAEWKAVLGGDALQARQWVQAAADLGHSEAQVLLGQWLLDGKGGPRDAQRAFKYIESAAAQKHPMGINLLGRCLDNGWGCKEDLPRATALFKQAADMGLDAGMYNYANQLAAGRGIAQDHTRALGWYSQAASIGHAKSMTKAGRYFEDGIVVEKDLALAFSSYKAAAEGGDFRGQFCYAGMLASRGQTQEALEWLRKVPLTATRAYMAEAGRLLAESPSEELRAVGRDMLARAA